jgi:hypothetical protein
MSSLFAWQNYYHPHVRNLAWVLASPALLSYLPNFNQPLTVLEDDFWQQQYLAYIPKLQQLDLNPQPLEDFLAQHKNHRLGYYFEYLLLFWLQDRDFHYFELIQHRATLFDGKITIGELDYLVKNHQTGQIEHWEAAIKFYLGYPPLTDSVKWLGANDRDSIGRKMEHLAQKQFRFASYQDYEIQQRCLVVKGRLFYPLSHKNLLERAHDTTLDCLAPQHLQANWLLWDEFISHPQAHLLQWRHVAKDEWMANQQINKKLPLLGVQALPPLASARPELFIGFDAEQQEQARCFVCSAKRDAALF